MPAEYDFDGYCRHYLEQWEQRATVRRLPRTRLSAEAARSELFPATLQPIMSHADVIARGPDVRHRILARATATFMLHVAILEVDVITDLCIKFVNADRSVPMPESARQVALTIATDETYHAFVAREFLGDLERHTGIVPAIDAPTTIVPALDEVRRHAPPDLKQVAETMVLCFAENFVTEELFGLSREAAPQGPFHTIMREHMMDEGRHQVFFQRLFRQIWTGLDEEQRSALGRLVPVYLDSFLSAGTYEASQRDLLEDAGFDPEAAARIASESMIAAFGNELPRKSSLQFMRNALHLVEVSGILEHEPTRRTLVERVGRCLIGLLLSHPALEKRRKWKSISNGRSASARSSPCMRPTSDRSCCCPRNEAFALVAASMSPCCRISTAGRRAGTS